MRAIGFWVGAAAMMAAPAAYAQEAGDAASVAYDAAYFAPFAPRTALDMVRRVPGFALNEGEERRGYAGAQSNVLINGEPPAAKQGIETILARIPASDVVRIEVVRGGVSAAGAQDVRVNIVRRAGEGEGVWEASVARARDGRIAPNGEAAWTGAQGALSYGVSGAYETDYAPWRGARSDSDAAGALLESRRERVDGDEREARVGAEAAFPLLGGDADLNLQVTHWAYDEGEAAALFDAAGAPSGAIRNGAAEVEDSAELGASLGHRFGAWRTNLGAVVTRRQYDAEESGAEFDAGGAFAEGAFQTQRLESGETILHGSAERAFPSGWRLQFGLEGALNTLEQRLSLTEDDGSGPTPVVLPSANVRVEETRAEASVMASGALAPRWTLEAGVAVETSRLTQSGDAAQETELTYWKPSIQLARAIGARDQVRVRLYRDVGQLDFEDFVSAGDIASSVINAGNPNLRPEASWRLELSGDWRFAEKGALSVTLYHWEIEDTLDVVPIGPPGDQLDAVGNIGDATAQGLRASLAAPLPWGAELRVDGFIQQSRARDPLTGARRTISEFEESALTVAFRQDFAAFAWGVDYEAEREAAGYRLDQIEREYDPELLTLWAETSFAGVKLRAWADNLLDSGETRTRTQFDPDRLGAADGVDTRTRRYGASFGVALSGTF